MQMQFTLVKKNLNINSLIGGDSFNNICCNLIKLNSIKKKLLIVLTPDVLPDTTQKGIRVFSWETQYTC